MNSPDLLFAAFSERFAGLEEVAENGKICHIHQTKKGWQRKRGERCPNGSETGSGSRGKRRAAF
jgi:hypothetical protein